MKKRDVCTRRGAEALAGELKRYWQAKGQDYEFEVLLVGGTEDHPIYGIRSNMRLSWQTC